MITKLVSKKKVLFNSSLYSLSNIIQKGMSFIFLPLFAIFLTPQDFGVVSIISNFIYLLSFIFSLSVESSIRRFYKELTKLHEKKIFISTLFSFLLIFDSILFFLMVLTSNSILEFFVGNIPFYPYFFFALLNLLFFPYFSILQVILQTIEKGFTFFANSLIFFISNIFLSFILIVYFDLGGLGQIIALAITNFLFFIYTFAYLIKRDLLIFVINRKDLIKALSYSLPFLPHLLGGGISIIFTNILLNNLLSISAVGIFNVTYKFISIIDVLQIAVISSFTPWFSEKIQHLKKNNGEITNFIFLIIKVFTLISFLYSLFFKEIVLILLPVSYHNSWIIFGLLVFAFQIRLIYYFYELVIIFNKKWSKFISISSILGNLTGIIFSIFFTSTFGLFTPGLSFLFHFLVSTIISFIFVKFISKFQINPFILLSYLLILIFFITMGFVIDYFNLFTSYNLTLLVKISLFLLFSYIFMAKELSRLRIFFKNFKFF